MTLPFDQAAERNFTPPEKEVEIKEGWGFTGTSKKAHYFVDGMALCRKWGFYHGLLEQGNDESPDNCAECKRTLAKRKEVINREKAT